MHREQLIHNFSKASRAGTRYPAHITRGFKNTSQDMVAHQKFDDAIAVAHEAVTRAANAHVPQQRRVAVDNLVAVIDNIATRGGLEKEHVAKKALTALSSAATGISPKTEMANMLKDAWDRHSLDAARKFGNEFVASSIGSDVFSENAAAPNVIRDTLPPMTRRRCERHYGLI